MSFQSCFQGVEPNSNNVVKLKDIRRNGGSTSFHKKITTSSPKSSFSMPLPTCKPSYPSFNFLLQLWSNSCNRNRDKDEVKCVTECLKVKPLKMQVFDRGFVAVVFYYHEWANALEDMLRLWELRLSHVHDFIPRLKSLAEGPCYGDELEECLRSLFIEKLMGLLQGEHIRIWEKKIADILEMESKCTDDLVEMSTFKSFMKVVTNKEQLTMEKELIMKRIEEFYNGVNSLVDNLEEKEHEIGVRARAYELENNKSDWESLHYLMIRECRRLEHGLPIFSYRAEILEQIHSEQALLFFSF